MYIKIFIIKRWLQYWFNGQVYDAQFGDVCWTGNYEPNEQEMRDLFKYQISATCKEYKYEVLGDIELIIFKPYNKEGDPLAQRGSAAWKTRMRVHNRKSWKGHVQRMIEEKIKFKETVRGGV